MSSPSSKSELMARALAEIRRLKAENAALRETAPTATGVEPIAVIGMGCRFPGARNPGAFWELLREGRSGVTEVPAERWSLDEYYAANGETPGKMDCRHGAFLEDVDQFDASFFGISPKEARSLDPQQRLLLEMAWEAMESAAIPHAQLAAQEVGVFVGLSGLDYAVRLLAPGNEQRIDPYFGTGVAMSPAAGRLSYFLKVTGPSMVLDTACSSSLVALHTACESLRRGECTAAFAGGASLILSPAMSINFSKSGLLARDGVCRPFDDGAQGYTRGEGAGMLLLKPLSAAQRDGDRILALVQGSAINQDGGSSGLTVPSGPSQQRVIRRALAQAGVGPRDIDYVETHGTATALGDPIEAGALGGVFAEDREAPLRIGSVKSNLGHLEAAAGMASLCKVILSLQHGEFAPQRNFVTPSRHIDWAEARLEVVTRHQPWARRGGRRLAGVSGFGFSGTNVHVVLGEAPEAAAATTAPRSGEALVVSARSPEALNAALSDYALALPDLAPAEWPDWAMTTQQGRTPFPYRAALHASDRDEAGRILTRWREKGRTRGLVFDEAAPEAPRIAFAFTGQGSQYRQMGRELYATAAVYRDVIDRCLAVAEPLLERDLKTVLFPDESTATADATTAADGDEIFGGTTGVGDDPINQTLHTQVLIFATEMALAALWRSWGIEPSCVLGHSIGEYAAACTAGVFSLEDGVRLTVARGQLMQERSAPGRMLTVFGEHVAVEPFLAELDGRVALAAENGPGILLLSGEAAAVAALAPQLEEAGMRTTPVPISHAFHSPLTEPILPAFRAVVEQVKLSPPRVTLISNLTGEPVTTEIATVDYWVRHLREAVQFNASMTRLHGQRPDFIIEVGPQPTLMGLDFCFQEARAQSGSTARWLASLRPGSEAWAMLSESLGRLWARGVAVNWSAVHAGRTLRKVELPHYPYQRKRHWLEALAPGVVAAAEAEDEAIEVVELPAAVETVPESAPVAPTIDEREPAVIVHDFVIGTICEVSGLDPADLSREVNLLEMGLDSLMFVRMGRMLEQRFTTAISAKQFYDDLHRVGPLIDHLLATVSEESIRTAPVAAAPEPSAPVPVPPRRAVVSPRESAPEPSGTMRANFAGLELEAHAGLTEGQTIFLRELLARFTARTGKSRDFTQRVRYNVADWKHSLQFKLSLKEAKYPIVAAKSAGARIWDLDGNAYLDFALGMGVHYLGHQPPYIVRAVQEQAGRQMGLGPQSDLVEEVARRIRELTGVERVAFAITGSQTVTLARRLARAATGRSKIVHFAGAYHGIDNDVLAVDTPEGTRPLSPGTTQGMVDDVIVLDYNSPESLARIAELGPELAAVLVEPVQSRKPSLQPHLFLRRLRRLTRELGIPLIFDEMINGFRILPGGAQAWFGIEADIVTYGKIVGGGLPLAVVAGKAKYLDWIDGGWWQFGDESGPRPQTIFTGGTHNRHPLALAAARAALEHLQQHGDALAWEVNRRTARMVRRLNWFFERESVPIRAAHFGSQFRLEAPQLPFEMEVLHTLMLEAGIYTWEQRTCCVSTVHTDADVDRFVAAVEDAVQAMRAGGFPLHSATILRRFVPMSSVQRRLYALCQREGGEAPYHLSGVWELDGTVDFERLQEAFQEVVLRHESLRTAFHEIDDEWVQEIIDEPRFFAERWTDDGAGPAVWLQRFIRPFDLTEAPLLRVGWVEGVDGQSWLMLDAHHLAVDGLSMETVLKEFCALYDGAVLPRVARQYRTAQAALEAEAFRQKIAPQEAYWVEQLAGELPSLELPLDQPRPRVFDFAGTTQMLELDRATTTALRGLAQRHGCSFYIVLMTGFVLLLQRLTGQRDLIVGLPVGGRGLPENEGVVGMFVNTLAVRFGIEASDTVAQLIRRVRNTCLDAYEHQEAPLSRVMERIGFTGRTDRNGLFDVMFSYENADQRRLEAGDLSIRTIDQYEGSGMFDFNIDVIEEDGVARARFHYATSLFEATTIERWRGYYAQLLQALVAADPDAAIASLPMLSAPELAQLGQWESDPESPDGGTLLELWNEQVKGQPQHVAVRWDGQSSTYAELDRQAAALADRLRQDTALKPGAVVAVTGPVDPGFVTAVLALWMARLAYVPIDPEGPTERNLELLTECDVQLVLSGQPLPWLKSVPMWRRDQEVALASGATGSRPGFGHAQAQAADLAYVLYTSGSTGKPKGVEITHDAITRSVRWRIDYYTFDEETRTLQLPSPVFDASIIDIWSTLGAGSTLVVPTPAERENLHGLARLIRDEGITNALMTPSFYGAMLEVAPQDLARLKLFCVAGEALSRDLVVRHFANSPQTRLINEYGPTENSVVSSAVEVFPDTERITIGRPVAGTRVLILDERGQRCAPGVKGELWLGGPGLARGYRHQPERTAERFMELPDLGGERCYRSGDLGRWVEGEIDYLGRVDDQVKLNGVRIELGEIEAAIRGLPEITEAAARVVRSGERAQLCAYYVASATVTETEVREALWTRLPAAMVPAHLWRLEQLPLTPNGKLDQRALPEPGGAVAAAAADDAIDGGWTPQGEREQVLVRALRVLLPQVRLQASASFFGLGGDSIRAIQLISRLRGEGWVLDMNAVYRQPTLAALAAALEPEARTSTAFVAEGDMPASGLQQWFATTFTGREAATFAQRVVWTLDAPLQADALRWALRDVARAHPAFGLRLRREKNGVWVQRYEADGAVIAFRAVERGAVESLAEVVLRVATELNPWTGPIAVMAEVRAAETAATQLMWVVHHAVVDGVSWRVLEQDLRAAYGARLQHRSPQLPAPSNAYREWHETMAAWSASQDAAAECAWWSEVLASTPSWPQDEAQRAKSGADLAALSWSETDRGIDALLEQAHGALGTQADELLLAAFAVALQRWAGTDQVMLELERHGRDSRPELDLGRTVGWFTSAFPVAFALPAAGDWRQIVRVVKEAVRATPQQGAGYRWLRAADRLPDGAEPEVAFNFLGRWTNSAAAGDGWQLELGASGAVESPRHPVTHALTLDGHADAAGLHWKLVYDAQRLAAPTVARLRDAFAEALRELAGAWPAWAVERTPADFTYSGLALPAWDALLRKHGWAANAVQDVRPVTPMQQGLLFQALVEPDSDAYFQQMTFTLTGVQSPGALADAWRDLCAAHEVARTVLVIGPGGVPLQIVLNALAVPVTWPKGNDAPVTADEVRAYAAGDRQDRFEVSRGPLMRVALFPGEAGDVRVVWSHHHLLMDGWCVGLWMEQLLAAYARRIDGVAAAVQVVATEPYYRWLAARDTAAARSYWSRLLEGHDTLTRVPAEFPGAHQEAPYQLEHVQRRLPEGLSQQIHAFAREQQTTPATLLQVAATVVLGRYTDRRDVVVGSIVSGRPAELPQVDAMMGLFINAVPVRHRWEADTTWTQAVGHLLDAARESAPHEHYPLARMQEDHPSLDRLFDHLVVYENYPMDEALRQQGDLGQVGIADISAYERTHYALSIIAVPVGEGIELDLNYDEGTYDRAQIEQLARQLERAFTELVLNSDQPMATAKLMPDDERAQLVETFNATAADYPQDATLVSLFRAQVERHGERAALKSGDLSWTYAQLAQAADGVSQALQAQGVKRGDRVAVWLPRGGEAIAAYLGIAQLGAAYVPLDPSYPAERTAFMVEDAACGAVVCSSAHAWRGASLPLVLVDATPPVTAPFRPQCRPEDSLYVIYTSGSTGQPKGCEITHRNVVRLMHNERLPFAFTEQDVWMVAHSLCFDFSVWEVYGALLYGGCAVIAAAAAVADPRQLVALLEAEGVTVLSSTPGAFYRLADEAVKPGHPQRFPHLRYVTFGGDRLECHYLESWRRVFGLERIQLINLYGITETTVHVTHHRLTERDFTARRGQSIVGRPLPETEVWVLDAAGQLMPVGAVGEWYVGGSGLARGYLNRPELTAARFIPHPWREGERLYRTGDLGRWLSDGTLEYLGRNDHQVQVRGYRVELGEIEARLLAHPAIDHAVVVPVRERDGTDALAAYLVARETVAETVLAKHLEGALPRYMVPAYWCWLSALPLTRNGKVDRAALPAVGAGAEAAPGEAAAGVVAPVAALSEREQQLAVLWREVLEVEVRSGSDHFFALGGHSLKAMRLASLVEERLGCSFAVADVFQFPELAAQAQRLPQAATSPASAEELDPELLDLLKDLSPDEIEGHLGE